MMTRDAKIGLLVALAFILIVGILLSEHVTTSTAPGQASLAVAGDRVRAATHAPLAPASALPKAQLNPDPQPLVAVATRDLLDAPRLAPAPTSRIELGQPMGGQIQLIRVEAPADPGRGVDPIGDAVAVRPLAPGTSLTTAAPPTTATPLIAAPVIGTSIAGAPMLGSTSTDAVGPQLVATPPSAATSLDLGVPGDLAAAARAGGAELVALDGARTLTAKPQATIPNGARVREYVAQPGDSLSRMASRLLGANTPANCQAIVALNPSLQKDSNRVIVGAKYLVPSDAWAAALRVNDEPVAAAVADVKADAKLDAKADAKSASADERAELASTKTVLYTVKTGDSLWKIAEREVGVRGAVAKIKQLNPDAFADGETVRVGMKLKLPVKPKA